MHRSTFTRLLVLLAVAAVGVIAQDEEEISAVYKPATMPMKSTTCSALNRAKKETKEIKLSELPSSPCPRVVLTPRSVCRREP